MHAKLLHRPPEMCTKTGISHTSRNCRACMYKIYKQLGGKRNAEQKHLCGAVLPSTCKSAGAWPDPTATLQRATTMHKPSSRGALIHSYLGPCANATREKTLQNVCAAADKCKQTPCFALKRASFCTQSRISGDCMSAKNLESKFCRVPESTLIISCKPKTFLICCDKE